MTHDTLNEQVAQWWTLWARCQCHPHVWHLCQFGNDAWAIGINKAEKDQRFEWLVLPPKETPVEGNL